MGSGPSQEDFDRSALQMYEWALQNTCLLPDIGIDESLLAYSGTDSNTVLQSFSNGLANSVPGYIEKLGASFAALSAIPNAVGLGALVISMIIEISVKSTSAAQDNSYSLLRRVFGEEKASAVRDTMSEYLKHHQTFINNDQRILEELRRLEQQLSNHLTILRNSLLHDGQMSGKSLKIWVNGASFHLQMLIHEARLNVQAGRPSSDYVDAIRAANNLYVQNLDTLLENYKTHKGTLRTHSWAYCVNFSCNPPECSVISENCRLQFPSYIQYNPCTSPVDDGFINHVFSEYEPITSLRSHFVNINNNLNFLIHQNGSFTLPSRT